MSKFKCLFIILIIFILSGCTVSSNVTLHDDGKVSETVLFPVDTNDRTEEQMKDYLSGILEAYGASLNSRDYNSEVVYGKTTSEIIISNQFNNICDYFKKTIFNQYVYNYISCTETDNFYEIKSETEHIDYCSDCTAWPALDNVKLNINLPLIGVENNADYVNESTYSWEFDQYTPKDKQIYLKINKKALSDAIKKQKTKEKVTPIIIYIIIAIVVLAIGIYIFDKLYKKYKENKLKY